jgi:hypothetical protein
LGYNTINCPVCDTEISLLDREERIRKGQTGFLSQMDCTADAKREREIAAIRLQGEIVTSDAEKLRPHLQELIIAKQQRLHILETQQARIGIQTPAHITMEIEDLRCEINDLQSQSSKLPYG